MKASVLQSLRHLIAPAALCIAALPAMATPGVLSNSSFETIEPIGGGLPTQFADWAGDSAEVVTQQQGITPANGVRMLRFRYTGPAGSTDGGRIARVVQLVDVSNRAADIAAGGLVASVTAKFNRVPGEEHNGKRFGLVVRAFSGSPATFPTATPIAGAFEHLDSDGQRSTWQTIGAALALPTGTTYVAVILEARRTTYGDEEAEDDDDDDDHGECENHDPFEGHYADAVTFTLPEQPNPLVAITGAATDIAGNTATLNGTANTGGVAAQAWFEYGTTAAYGVSTTPQPLAAGSSAATALNAPISNLLPHTPYSFRVRVQNAAGTIVSGANQTFVTGPFLPTAVTNLVANITTSSATLRGTVNPNASPTTVVFEYGADETYGSTTTPQILGGDADVPVLADLAGLPAHAVFHYRVVATNSFGTVSGADVAFTTTTGTPVLGDDVTVAKGIPRTVAVLANDTDPDDDPLTITAVTNGARGTVTTDGATVTYTPVSLTTVDTFTYTASDGFGGSATATVTVYSLTSQAGFYAGFIENEEGVDGQALITMSRTGALSGRIMLDGLRYRFKGQLDDNCEAYIIISRNVTQVPVTMHLQLLPADSPTLAIDVTEKTMTGDTNFWAGEAVRSGTTVPPKARYTVLIPPDPASAGDPAFPQGVGYASLVLSRSGAVRIIGATGDGSPFSTASSVRADNTMPFYAGIYALPRGNLFGTLTLRDVPGISDLDGELTWFKPIQGKPGTLYPAGFTTSTPVIGSLFAQTSNVNELLVLNGVGGLALQFSGGNLAASFTADAALGTRNPAIVTAPLRSLSVAITTGKFVGSFTHPTSSRTTRFLGMIFQKTNRGAGYFLGTSESGPVQLTPAP